MCLSLSNVLILAKKAHPDKLQPYAHFTFGLHCLSKLLFTVIQNKKVTVKTDVNQ